PGFFFACNTTFLPEVRQKNKYKNNKNNRLIVKYNKIQFYVFTRLIVFCIFNSSKQHRQRRGEVKTSR
ncbi:hypothetical protein, partial [Klebsiella pneumoniae]|uniref:hypothetical protein n=1 Tax=Klebsiella pneumoniae TaxID=573 RepID=UPI0025A20912